MKEMTRRSAVGTMVGATGVTLAAGNARAGSSSKGGLKGNVNHAVCKWCYKKIPFEDLCKHSVEIGITGIDLLGPKDWPTVKKYGLTCSMASGPGGINKGWNRVEQHDELVAKSEELLPQIAEAGLPNMIVFSGRREGLSDADGIVNCAKGLKRITPLAEKLGVTICMELLNSKRNHKDYQCDHTAWGVELAKSIGSDRFKLLYDIFHMQIMEGDIIGTIQENIDYIGHFHTGGVPGRNEIDDTQELNYTRIMQAIVDTGYKGFVAQEFIPKRDPISSLAQAIKICDV